MLNMSRENKCEGLLSLLPDCRVGVRAKTIEVECIGITHDNLLPQLWPYESDVRVTRQAASDSRTAGLHWLQVRAWHDRSYIA